MKERYNATPAGLQAIIAQATMFPTSANMKRLKNNAAYLPWESILYIMQRGVNSIPLDFNSVIREAATKKKRCKKMAKDTKKLWEAYEMANNSAHTHLIRAQAFEEAKEPGLMKHEIIQGNMILAAAREILNQIAAESEWVSVNDYLPEDCLMFMDRKVINCMVLMKSRYPNGKPLVAKRQRYLAGYPHCKWMWSHHDDDRITHWMLPDDLLEEGEKNEA